MVAVYTSRNGIANDQRVARSTAAKPPIDLRPFWRMTVGREPLSAVSVPRWPDQASYWNHTRVVVGGVRHARDSKKGAAPPEGLCCSRILPGEPRLEAHESVAREQLIHALHRERLADLTNQTTLHLRPSVRRDAVSRRRVAFTRCTRRVSHSGDSRS